MANIGHFLDMLDAVSRRDWKSIEKIGKSLADEERKKKHFKSAHQISEALDIAMSKYGFDDQIGTSAAPLTALSSIPSDLLTELDCTTVPDIVIQDKIQKKIDEFIGEWRAEGKLREKKLSPRRTVLLYGPPGCGKTHLAKHIASQLGVRLFVVRFDSLISSFLGETGANLRKVFEFANSNRCAILLDELDAVAKLRDDKNELGELKRVVISLLQNIDQISGRSIILSATNHPHVLDSAIWRRFEVVLKLDIPEGQERVLIFEKNLNEKMPLDMHDLIIKCSEGMTGADIVQIANSARRQQVVGNHSTVFEPLFCAIIEQLKRLSHPDKKNDERKIFAALSLKKYFSKAYSFKDLEALTDVAHSTLHSKYSSIGGIGD